MLAGHLYEKIFRIFCGAFPPGLALIVLFSGCSLLPRFNKRLEGNRAFIAQWPDAPGDSRLRLAVKDNIDMKGVVTAAGSELFAKTHKPAERCAVPGDCAAAEGADRGQDEPDRVRRRTIRFQ